MRWIYRAAGFILSLAAGLTGWSGKAFAPPTSVSIQNDITFGTVAGCGAASAVSLSPSGTISTSGCAFHFGGASPGLGRFRGNGSHVATVQTATISNATGATMTVNSFKFATTGGSFLGTNTFTYNPAANDKIDIGAKLNLKAGQAAGTYSGTFTVTWNQL